MPPAVFEPAIPANQWPQTHAYERVATGIGLKFTHVTKYKIGSENSNLIELATEIGEFRVNNCLC
jgi:hypothetical protein